jgi:hypothetical protein
MIANKPVRLVISFIHLSIAFFCIAFCVGFTLTDKGGSLRSLIFSNDFFPVLLCFSVGFSAFIGFAAWQRDNFLLSKRITYFTAFLGLVEYITILSNEADEMEKFLAMSMFFVAPILFVFLLGFSKVGTLFSTQKNEIETLDASFLQENNETKQVYFWKVNRIVATTFLTFSFFVAVIMLDDNAPLVILFPPFLLLSIGSILLLVFPKTGSYIFSTLSIIIGLIVLPLVVFSILKVDGFPNNNDIIFATSTIFFVSVFFITIAMLLLSKEAKQEWK